MHFLEHERIGDEPLDTCEYRASRDAEKPYLETVQKYMNRMWQCAVAAGVCGFALLLLVISDEASGNNYRLIPGRFYGMTLLLILTLVVASVAWRLIAETVNIRMQLLTAQHETQWVIRHALAAHIRQSGPSAGRPIDPDSYLLGVVDREVNRESNRAAGDQDRW